MKLINEYKNPYIYLLMGLIPFVLPFTDLRYLILVFFTASVFFAAVPSGSRIFLIFASDSDNVACRLDGMTHLCFSIALLTLISYLSGPEMFPLYIAGAAIAVATLGDGMADIITKWDNYRKNDASGDDLDINFKPAKGSIVLWIIGSSSAFAVAWWIASRMETGAPYEMLIFLSVIGGLVGALLESISIREDNFIIPFGAGMAMWLFYSLGKNWYYVDSRYLLIALCFAFLLGYLAYRVRIADISAMLSATLLGVIIIIFSRVEWFLLLLGFFMLGGGFTRYKYDYKKARGSAEGKGGIRTYKNVFSNSVVALAFAISYRVYPHYGNFIIFAYIGAVATATADTLASEIGGAYRGEPRMITTMKKVKPGTDGGVSSLGEAASIGGAFTIAVLAVVLGVVNMTPVSFIIITAGGLFGSNFDSLLGATLQQKGLLSNNGVNLVATAGGAIFSGALFILISG